jgi:hypothetical protein
MHRQDTDGEKRVAFSNAVDDSTDGHDEVKTLRATLKEKDQRPREKDKACLHLRPVRQLLTRVKGRLQQAQEDCEKE